MKRIWITALENGYKITLDIEGPTKEWVARSWAEVLELLSEIGAPDYYELNDMVSDDNRT